jgi:hypothetical protein
VRLSSPFLFLFPFSFHLSRHFPSTLSSLDNPIDLLSTSTNPTPHAGLAQHCCLPCSRYFADAVSLETHLKGKPHKRRLHKLKEEPYTIEESRAAVGLGVDKGAYGKRKEEEAKKAAEEAEAAKSAEPKAMEA